MPPTVPRRKIYKQWLHIKTHSLHYGTFTVNVFDKEASGIRCAFFLFNLYL